MSKPRIFIGSSVESLDVAFSVQESLEHEIEVTVWTQGIFQPSRYAMEDLINALAESDFALFVFAPDDVATIRDVEKKVVRDNVVFELGLFVGRLGRERCFILVPRGSEELHLPSDLLGLTPLSYDADRTDHNLLAALGPACQRIRRAALQIGTFAPIAPADSTQPEPPPLIDDPNDIISVLQSWLGKRRSAENTAAIHFNEVDRALGLVAGATEAHIATAAATWGYVVERQGKKTILFRDRSSGDY